MRGITLIFLFAVPFGNTYGNTYANNEGLFHNHFHSDLMVSPAQFYHSEGIETDVSMPMSFLSLRSEPPIAKAVERNSWDIGLRVASMYRYRYSPLRLGFELNYQNKSLAIEDPSASSDQEGALLVMTPKASFTYRNIVFGLEIPISYQSASIEMGARKERHEVTGFVFKPGVVYSAHRLEAGVAFETEIDQQADIAKEKLALESPARFIAHGRYAFDRFLTVGAILNYELISSLDSRRGSDNRLGFYATGEYDLGKAKIETLMGYNSSTYRTQPVWADEIAFIDTGVSGDFWLTNLASVGAGFRWKYGTDANNNGIEFTKNNWDMTLRGNYLF